MNRRKNQIYVIGPHRLQNELMASFLEAGTGMKCFVEDDIGRVPRAGRAVRGKNLILFDCRGQGSEELLADIRPGKRGPPRGGFLALFNLSVDVEFENKALGLGVRGFFYENDRPDTLLTGVKAILANELWVPRKKIAEILEERHPDFPARKSPMPLTSREKEILLSLAQGATNETIGKTLFISPHTVKTHIYHIFRKLKVNNRIQAANWAMKHLP